jgi:alkylhydroperoxidase/carboxymuconolactone decarboxylase family protein
MNQRIKNIVVNSGPVLVFGGAYSNLEAMEAIKAVADARGIAPENVICTGDTPGYCAEPAECVDLLAAWGCHAIAGNVETNLVNGTDDCGCGFGDGSRCDMFAKLWYDYAQRNVTPENLAFMAGLPDQLRFSYGGKAVTVLHGSPRNQSEFVWRSTPTEDKLAFCAEARLQGDAAGQAGPMVVIGGHCGLPFAHQLDEQHLWLNAGVIGMPANDGTPRTWYLILDDSDGFDYAFHALEYDHRAAKSKMIDDRRLPVSYAATLTTGIWDNTEIMPPAETAREGIPLDAEQLKAEAINKAGPNGIAPAPDSYRGVVPNSTKIKENLPLKNLATMNKYTDPKDLKSFGKIAEWQEEMGEKFFDWYSGVTEGDSALTEREKALIALAVSHAIQCSYCIDAYTTNSLQAGADEEQMMEAVHVAAAVKAGTTLIYARQMQRQVDKITM